MDNKMELVEFGMTVLQTDYPGDTRDLRTFLSGEGRSVIPVAVLVKTEGNGCVNDFTRIMAFESYNNFFRKAGWRDVGIVVSGGTEGVLCPHLTLFYKRQVAEEKYGESPSLTIGVSRTRDIAPLEVGTVAQAKLVAAAVSNAMQSAQLERADEVKFVQVKCPLLRDEDIASTIKNGTPVVTSDPYESMAFSRGASALGSALALREISSLLDSDICVNWDLFSAVTSVSSGSELRHCEVLVFGNSCQVPGDLSVDSFLMQDTIDASGFLSHCNGIDYFTNHDDIRQVFAKADPVGMIRGKRTVMLNDSDIQSTRHARAAVGGLLAAFVGRTDIYVSGGAEHQGPRGGGPVAVISAKSRTQLGDCSNG